MVVDDVIIPPTSSFRDEVTRSQLLPIEEEEASDEDDVTTASCDVERSLEGCDLLRVIPVFVFSFSSVEVSVAWNDP